MAYPITTDLSPCAALAAAVPSQNSEGFFGNVANEPLRNIGQDAQAKDPSFGERIITFLNNCTAAKNLRLFALSSYVEAVAFYYFFTYRLFPSIYPKDMTLPHYLAMSGKAQVLKKIGKYNINISSVDQKGRAPLHYAAKKGNIECITVLHRLGADLGAKDHYGSTPLHYAAKYGHIECTTLLHTLGADLNARDNKGKTALFTAVEAHRADSLSTLLALGANQYTQERTPWISPLHIACGNNLIECVIALAENKTGMQPQDRKGDAPIHYAAQKGHARIIRLLLAYRAEVNLKGCFEKSALHLAAENGHMEAVKALLENGADSEAVDSSGQTPVFAAVCSGNIEIIHFFYESSANFSHVDNDGKTPLNLAETKTEQDVIEAVRECVNRQRATASNKPSWTRFIPIV